MPRFEREVIVVEAGTAARGCPVSGPGDGARRSTKLSKPKFITDLETLSRTDGCNKVRQVMISHSVIYTITA